MLARSQMSTSPDRSPDQSKESEGDNERKKRHPSYGGTLFLMSVGAVFLALNVAPTAEILLIAYKMTPWHALAVLVLRSEERPVGEEWARTCRSRWSPYH